METIGRVISIDPGMVNVGLAVLDGDWKIRELRHSELAHGKTLTAAHFAHRTQWVGILADEIQWWAIRYVYPHILLAPEDGVRTLVIVEENDLKLHQDWAGIVAGILTGLPGVTVMTVLPMEVTKWMHRMGLPGRADRAEKKRFSIEFVRGLPGAEQVESFDDHSCDACMNAMYVRERFFSGKKTTSPHKSVLFHQN